MQPERDNQVNARLDLRDTIIDNRSTPNGTGLTVVFRRSSGAAGTASKLLQHAEHVEQQRLLLGNGGRQQVHLRRRHEHRDDGRPLQGGSVHSRDRRPARLSVVCRPDVSEHDRIQRGFSSTSIRLFRRNSRAAGHRSRALPPTLTVTRVTQPPDVGADEFTGTPLGLTPPAISYSLLGNAAANTTRSFKM